MDSCDDTPKGWVSPFGHPRIKACSRLPMAFRSVPRPSSPPGAKASTECPSLARDPLSSEITGSRPVTSPRISTMHRNHPQGDDPAHRRITLAQHTTVASERSPRSLDAEAPGQTCPPGMNPEEREQARPETHQNLIHPDKDLPLGQTQEPAPSFEDTTGVAVLIRTSMPISFASPRYRPDTSTPMVMVEVIGLEPTTPCLQSRCSPS